MPKPGAIVLSPKGFRLTRNPARIMFAAEAIRTMTTTDAITAIVKQWGIHRTTAWKDIAAAKQLIAHELDAIEVRAGETRRNERIADKAEKLADKAAEVNDWAAAATLHRSAIAASREVSRLTGAYAPDKIDVNHRMTSDVPLQLDAILGILDETGIAALHVVLGQIEEAKAAGRLTSPEDETIQDADIVDGESDGGAGESSN